MVTECKVYRLRTFIKVIHRPLHEIKTIEVRLKGAGGECSAVAEASDAWRESRGYVYVSGHATRPMLPVPQLAAGAHHRPRTHRRFHLICLLKRPRDAHLEPFLDLIGLFSRTFVGFTFYAYLRL